MAGSLLWTIIKLVLTLAVIAVVLWTIAAAVNAINAAAAAAKEQLAGKGINVDSHGVAVKTDKRAYTNEEVEDRARSSVPWAGAGSTLVHRKVTLTVTRLYTEVS